MANLTKTILTTLLRSFCPPKSKNKPSKELQLIFLKATGTTTAQITATFSEENKLGVGTGGGQWSVLIHSCSSSSRLTIYKLSHTRQPPLRSHSIASAGSKPGWGESRVTVPTGHKISQDHNREAAHQHPPPPSHTFVHLLWNSFGDRIRAGIYFGWCNGVISWLCSVVSKLNVWYLPAWPEFMIPLDRSAKITGQNW